MLPDDQPRVVAHLTLHEDTVPKADEDIYGHLLRYQETEEFQREQALAQAKMRRLWAQAQRSYNAKYPDARKLRKEAKVHGPELYHLQKGRCALCGKHMKRVYEIDHIVPISKGGTSVIENLQVVHHSCNSSKGNRTDQVTPQAQDAPLDKEFPDGE